MENSGVMMRKFVVLAGFTVAGAVGGLLFALLMNFAFGIENTYSSFAKFFGVMGLLFGLYMVFGPKAAQEE